MKILNAIKKITAVCLVWCLISSMCGEVEIAYAAEQSEEEDGTEFSFENKDIQDEVWMVYALTSWDHISNSLTFTMDGSISEFTGKEGKLGFETYYESAIEDYLKNTQINTGLYKPENYKEIMMYIIYCLQEIVEMQFMINYCEGGIPKGAINIEKPGYYIPDDTNVNSIDAWVAYKNVNPYYDVDICFSHLFLNGKREISSVNESIEMLYTRLIKCEKQYMNAQEDVADIYVSDAKLGAMIQSVICVGPDGTDIPFNRYEYADANDFISWWWNDDGNGNYDFDHSNAIKCQFGYTLYNISSKMEDNNGWILSNQLGFGDYYSGALARIGTEVTSGYRAIKSNGHLINGWPISD